MKIELIQGSPEWHAHRASHYNASEAAAMLGLSKYKTRQDLIREKSTGITPEIDDATQRRFDRGHEIEAIARTFAEEFLDLDIGEALQPCVFAEEIDGLKLSASLDGLNGSTMWECKSLNAELKDAMSQDRIPDMYHPQMEQGLMLSGAKKCLFTASDGTREGTYHVYYVSNSKTLARIIPSWKQFHEDLANYQHVEAKPAPVAAAIDALPALLVQVEGRVLATNLDVFKESALKFIAGINTNLQTDQDFADAEKTVKFCKDGEERLELVKAQALAQTASIDDLFRTIDNISAELKTKRLQLDKLVKAEKENRKIEIIQQAKDTFQQHVSALNKRIGGSWMPGLMPAFAEAIKGLKSLDSMREKVGTTLANAKIEANEIADRITDNRNSLDGDPPQYGYWMFLFPDFASVCTKAREDFDALLASRIAKHEASIEAERARIQAEERAKAEREAAAKIEAAKQEAVRQERERAEEERQKEWLEEQRAQLLADSEKKLAESSFTTGVCVPATGGPGENSAAPNTTREGEPAMPAGAGPEPAQPVVEPTEWAIYFCGYGGDLECEPAFMDEQWIYTKDRAMKEADKLNDLALEHETPRPGNLCIYEARPAPAGYGKEMQAAIVAAQDTDQFANAGKAIDDGATMKLGDISARLGFTVTADFMASLGFQHIRQEKNAKLYRACDFGGICQAIASHVMEVSAWDRRLAE